MAVVGSVSDASLRRHGDRWSSLWTLECIHGFNVEELDVFIHVVGKYRKYFFQNWLVDTHHRSCECS